MYDVATVVLIVLPPNLTIDEMWYQHFYYLLRNRKYYVR